MDGLDRRVAGQPLGDRAGRGLLPLDPGEQGAHAAQGQIGVEGRAGHAGAVGPPGQGLVILGVGRHDRAADHVGMAVDELGRGMDHEVGAQLDRVLKGRRQEGVVADDLGARRMGAGADVGDVDQAQQRESKLKGSVRVSHCAVNTLFDSHRLIN